MAKKVYDFSEFNPAKQLPPVGILIYSGTTGSGKTELMYDNLYFYRNDFDIVLAFVGSAETAERLRDHIPDIMIHEEWRPRVLEKLYRDQEMDRKLKRKMKRVCVFIDDMSYLKRSIFETPIIRRCACACRHANMLIMCSTQYCKDIPRYMRDNTKIAFLCANKNPEMRKVIYESYNPGFSHFADFDRVFVDLTSDKFEVMVCLIAGNQNYDMEKSVYFYKATPNREFIVKPTAKMWQTHQQRYNPNYFLNHLSQEEQDEIQKQALHERKQAQLRKRIPGHVEVRKHYLPPQPGSQFYHYSRNR